MGEFLAKSEAQDSHPGLRHKCGKSAMFHVEHDPYVFLNFWAFSLAYPPRIHDARAVMVRTLPVLLIIGLLLAFRALGHWFPDQMPVNFQPLAAVFFCGAILARSWKGFAIPAGVWLLTYPLGVGHTGSVSTFAVTLVSFGVIFLLGQQLSKRGMATMLLGSIAGAALFHFITCSAAWSTGFWMEESRYPMSLSGLWQSIWLGAPGDVIPSWVFLRNLAAANFLFTAVFIAARMRMPLEPIFSAKQDLAESN